MPTDDSDEQTMRRRPSQAVEGDDWIRQFTNTNTTPEPVNRELFPEPSRNTLFEPEPVPLDSENDSETVSTESIDEYDWLYEADNSDNRLNEIMKEDVRVESDDNVKNLLIENIMSLIHNNVFRLVPMYLPRLESGELVLRPSVVDTKSVEHYLRNYKTITVLELSFPDEHKFDAMVRNYLIHAPSEMLDKYIAFLPQQPSRGGTKTKKQKKQKKTKKNKKNKTLKKYKFKRV